MSVWGVWNRNRRDTVAVPRQHGAEDWDGDSKTKTRTHRWLVGDQSAVSNWLAAAEPRSLGVVPGHARLRGPFTASGTVARSLAPALLANHMDLVRAYGGDLLAAAPDLAWMLGPPRPATAHQHDRTKQVAENLGTLTLAYAQATGVRHGIVVLDAESLDATDSAWLTALLAQADPARFEVVVMSATGDVPAALATALDRHATRSNLPHPRGRKALGPQPSTRQLARAYVASECLSDDPAHHAAYAALDAAERATLHDQRATRLELLAEPALRLGAIPFHRERGSAPAAAVTALTYAVTQCFKWGWYDAALAFGDRLRELLGGEGFAMPLGA